MAVDYDKDYVRQKLTILLRDLHNHDSGEVVRVLARIANVADGIELRKEVTRMMPREENPSMARISEDGMSVHMPGMGLVPIDWDRFNGFSASDAMKKPDELVEKNASIITELSAKVAALTMENKRLDGLINNPHTENFLEAVKLEAAHQRERWGSEHDGGKEPSDWFWLLGFLAGKAIRPAQPRHKVLHHIITTAAACLNWHANESGFSTSMKAGAEGGGINDSLIGTEGVEQ